MKPTWIEGKMPIQEIDWSVPQWVISKDKKDIVLTSGEHEGSNFTGTCLPNSDYPNGEYCDTWDKESFIKLQGPLTITIEN